MTPFTLTRTRPGSPAEVLKAWTYRPTAGHIREAGLPEEVVNHLATHLAYTDGEVAYELVPTSGVQATP